MAFIGMRYVVAAKVASHTDGAEPTYSAGMVIGKAIQGNLTITRGNNPLRADDAIAEDDNGITAMSLELGLDDLLENVQAYLGLLKEVATGSGTSAVTEYFETSAPANDVGVGYIRVRQKDGNIIYQAVWVYNTKFSTNNENTATKGETIEWQTPTATGNCKGLLVDGSGNLTYRKKRNFSSYEDAVDYLKDLAAIT